MRPVLALLLAGRQSLVAGSRLPIADCRLPIAGRPRRPQHGPPSEVVGVDIDAGRGDDEELPEVHQLAVHILDIACEPRCELVEVALDGEKEDVAAGDGLDPLLRRGRAVEDAEDDVTLGVVLVEVFFGRLQVEIEIAHTRPVVERREKGSVGACVRLRVHKVSIVITFHTTVAFRSTFVQSSVRAPGAKFCF